MGEIDETWFGPRNPAEERLEKFVRGLTYQEGWEFRLARGPFAGGAHIAVRWVIDDVDAPGRESHITGVIGFQSDYGDRAFNVLLYDLWNIVTQFEAHERMEQLRVDGQTIWEPHPDGSRDDPLACSPDFAALPACLSERMPA